MKVSVLIAGVLFACYCAAAAYLFFNQRSFIYFPSRAVDHPHTVRTFELEGETIDVVVLNEGRDEAVLYFGGNAENVVFNAPEFSELFPQHTIHLVNYRGYGGSSGQPTEQSLYGDAGAIFDSISAEHTTLTVIGKSLGSGVASWVAANRNIERLVLVTPYDSIAQLAAARYWMFPVNWLLRDRFDSVGRAGDIKVPTLVIIAEHDRIIPRQHTLNLIAALPAEQVESSIINNADHNSLTHTQAYFESLREFVNR